MTNQKNLSEELTGIYNYEMCKGCGGLCCQKMAGIYSPEQFGQKLTAEFIHSLLLGGFHSIDWWDGDVVLGGGLSHVYYIRPRHVDGSAIDDYWRGTCINWNKEIGCTLTEETRPFQCKMLIPDLSNGCKYNPDHEADKESMALRWREYQHILIKAIALYRETEIPNEEY